MNRAFTKTVRGTLICLCSLLNPMPLHGAVFSILSRASDLLSSDPIYQALSANCDAVESSINNGFLSATERQAFLNSVSESHPASESVLLMDRASKPSPIVLGNAASYAGFFDGESITSLPTTVAANSLPSVPGVYGTSILLGTSFKSLGIFKRNLLRTDKRIVRGEKFMMFLHGSFFSRPFQGAFMKFSSVGLNGRYWLFEPVDQGFFLWNGLNLATGVNYSSHTSDFYTHVYQSSSSSVGQETATITVDMDYTLTLKSTIITIPLELSTSITVLGLVTLYAGAGADLTFGSSSLSGTSTGSIIPSYSGVVFVSNLFSGTSTFAIDDGTAGAPSLIAGRGFGGLQFNLTILRVGGEFNILTNGAKSGGVYARFVI